MMTSDFNQIKEKQQGIFDRMGQLMSTMAAPVRLKLIHFLSQSPLTVEVLAQKMDQSVANTSMHLRKMLNEGLVKVEIHGQKRQYSLHPALFLFWEQCQNMAMTIDPSLKLISSEETQWNEDLAETLRQYKAGQLVFLDVRPADEIRPEDAAYDKLSVLHIPMPELERRWQELPKSKKLLVICRGRWCALSHAAVELLQRKKLKTFRANFSWYGLTHYMETKKEVV